MEVDFSFQTGFLSVTFFLYYLETPTRGQDMNDSFFPFGTRSSALFFLWSLGTSQTVESMRSLFHILKDPNFRLNELPQNFQTLIDLSKKLPMLPPLEKSSNEGPLFLNSVQELVQKSLGDPTVAPTIEHFPEICSEIGDYHSGTLWKNQFPAPMVRIADLDWWIGDTVSFDNQLGRLVEIIKHKGEILFDILPFKCRMGFPKNELRLEEERKRWPISGVKMARKVLKWQSFRLSHEFYCRTKVQNGIEVVRHFLKLRVIGSYRRLGFVLPLRRDSRKIPGQTGFGGSDFDLLR